VFSDPEIRRKDKNVAERLKITIRAIEPDDYVALAKILEGPKAQAGTLQLPYPSQEMWKKRLENRSDNRYSLLAIVDNQVVGQASINVGGGRQRHMGDLGITVHDDYQGRGVGTALMAALLDLGDNWLNLSRIQLEVYTDNVPAIALYKKFNFEVEGTLRNFAFRNGSYVDAYIMARLRATSQK
jgi:putative acetyltransferase